MERCDDCVSNLVSRRQCSVALVARGCAKGYSRGGLAGVRCRCYVGGACDCRRDTRLPFVSTDINVGAGLARKPKTALVSRYIEWGSEHGVVACVDGWTSGKQSLGECWSAVVLERAELGIAGKRRTPAAVLDQIVIASPNDAIGETAIVSAGVTREYRVRKVESPEVGDAAAKARRRSVAGNRGVDKGHRTLVLNPARLIRTVAADCAVDDCKGARIEYGAAGGLDSRRLVAAYCAADHGNSGFAAGGDASPSIACGITGVAIRNCEGFEGCGVTAADGEYRAGSISVYDSAGRQIALKSHIIRREGFSNHGNILEIGSRTDVD